MGRRNQGKWRKRERMKDKNLDTVLYESVYIIEVLNISKQIVNDNYWYFQILLSLSIVHYNFKSFGNTSIVGVIMTGWKICDLFA